MKVAIVTGASSGLGRAIAIEYAKQGWNITCSDLQSDAPVGELISTVDMINQTNAGSGAFVRADVSSSEDIQNLISATVARYGRLDIMVNNAGISLESYNQLGPKPIAETDDSTFDKTMAVNSRSVFLGCKYAVRQFLKQEPHAGGHRGWIINTASVYGLKPEIGHISYCASKAAVVHMTKCIARENGPSKIHCNAICPGFVKTNMDSAMLSDETHNAGITALHPWGSLGLPQDVAKAAVFLASEQAAWITGVVLPVDGGYMTA
ncbi:putative short chain type dehydrogenase [Ilyonectria sp. MPI-CAGE-AT-0026]|nr:putative short chain type dehydrogenase [Ilyonectria sp. MPI-CAGE-AT-0026]